MPRFSNPPRILIIALVIASFATIVYLQTELHPVNAARNLKEIRYIPDRDVLKLTSFGYQRVYADLLWIQAIQYLATPFESPDAKYEWLGSIFHAITDLDPQFIAAYRLGSSWLTLLKRDGPAGVVLLEKGMKENPKRWELPHDAAMIYFVDQKDRTKALDMLKVAIAKPSCPMHVRAFAGRLLVEKNEGWIAIDMWLNYLEQNKTEIVQTLAMENLCKVQTQMVRLGVKRFEEKNGRRPADLAELIRNDREMIRPGVGFDVTDGIAYDADTGKIWSPKLHEIQVEKGLYMLRMAIEIYEADQGRAPRSLEELHLVIRRPPRHPRRKEGYGYAYDPESRTVRVTEPGE